MPPQTAMCVLVIDDDEMSRELLAALLRADGYEVQAAESGDAALAMVDAAHRSPDVVLTDMQMPGSTPDQLAGRLRRACGRRTRLIAMSGSQPALAGLARYDGFLLKPFGIAELANAIEQARISLMPASKAKKETSPGKSNKKAGAKKMPATLDLAASAVPASKTKMGPPIHTGGGKVDPPAEGAPILNEGIYAQLAGSMPAPQLREMYAMCLSDARARIGVMRSLAAAQDDAQFMREAHTIKGSCGMLGATELHLLAEGLEKHGPGPDGNAVNSLDELSRACDRLERMLGARA